MINTVEFLQSAAGHEANRGDDLAHVGGHIHVKSCAFFMAVVLTEVNGVSVTEMFLAWGVVGDNESGLVLDELDD